MEGQGVFQCYLKAMPNGTTNFPVVNIQYEVCCQIDPHVT